MMHLLLASAAEKSAFKGLLGALHPGVVHFPIALLAVAALLEILQMLRKRREPAAGTAILAYLAAAAAVPASLFGFILADYGGSEGPLVDLHQWMGVASTVVALVAAGCAIKAKSSAGSLLGLRIGLILGTGLVLITGYLGGELVFGEGHITKYVKILLGMQGQDKTHIEKEKPIATEPKPSVPLLKPAEPVSADKVDFVKEIAPIIKDMCFKCHGGEKVKGKLKLNTKALALEGGESGKAILPSKPTLSKFLTSLTDPDEDVLMPPPKEKVRPTKDQIEKVRKWIEQGADWPDGYEFKK
jgi:uncharacterized membrane protein